MTFSDTSGFSNPGFKLMVFFKGESEIGVSYGQIFYRTLIGNHT